MTVSLKHKFVSAKSDGADATRVRASNWNDEHDLIISQGTILGRTAAGDGPATELTVSGDLSLASGVLGIGSSVATLTGTQTLTGKTISGASNTITNVPLSTGVTGTLPVTNGGSGATTLTGVLRGNGTSAFTVATAGTDFVAPGAATTFTATQTFSGSASTLAMVVNDIAEVVTVSATAATGTIAYDITTQSVLFYTTNASANFTVNLRASSGTSLNTALAIGQSITVVFLVTNGATPYYNTSVQVDGTTSGVTTRWQGGTAPAAGNASSVDVYAYTVIKTANATFSVFASQTRFA